MKNTARVLFDQKRGNLLIGHRVSLYDAKTMVDVGGGQYHISLDILDYDGWIIYHPEMSPFAIFLNREYENGFEDLGEL